MKVYNDDAICLNPQIVEKMSKEYFSALQNRGFKIVSLSRKNSQFFERHVKELATNFFKLSSIVSHGLFNNLSLKNSGFEQNFCGLGKEILEMFGLEDSIEKCQTLSLSASQNISVILTNIFNLEILMLKNFEGNDFFNDCMNFAVKTCDCLKELSNSLSK